MNALNVEFQNVIIALLDTEKPFPGNFLHKFSDMAPEDFRSLKNIWKDVPANRRVSLLEDLEEIAEADTLVCFDDLGQFVLSHEQDADVITAAIRLLWECEDQKLIPTYMDFLASKDDNLRGNAAAALGLFVYLGELDKIPKNKQKTIENTLLEVYKSDPEKKVRRKSLESLGFSTRKEVVAHINKEYLSNDAGWKASALFAMGQSADIRWNDKVLQSIDDENSDIRTEAIRAAGQLELKAARKPLLDLLKYPFDLDLETRSITIWSLSQIGGNNVRKRIEKILKDTDDDEEIIFIEKALENLEFTEAHPEMDLFSIQSDENLDEDFPEDLDTDFLLEGDDEDETDE